MKKPIMDQVCRYIMTTDTLAGDSLRLTLAKYKLARSIRIRIAEMFRIFKKH